MATVRLHTRCMVQQAVGGGPDLQDDEELLEALLLWGRRPSQQQSVRRGCACP